MRKHCLALLFLTPLAACKPWEPEAGNTLATARGELRVEGAWVRLPAVPRRPGAAYFTIHGGSSPATLQSVSSPRVERIEFHDSIMEGNVMRMVPLANPAVPAEGQLAFAPGGKHAMLFGIDPAVAAGWRVPLTFTFAGGRQITVEAEVRGLDGASPHGH